jgi:hypothetical protein
MMSQRTLHWTTTKTPATGVGMALEREVKAPSLEIGIPVVKVTTRGKLKTRVLTLSRDHMALFCTHYPLQRGRGVLSTVAGKLKLPVVSRKGIALGWSSSSSAVRDRYVRFIDVADLDAVETSIVGTTKLERARLENRLRGFESAIDKRRHQIVSIHHRGNQSLDLLVPDDRFRAELVKALQQMQAAYRRAKLGVSRDSLLLRYIWYDVDANRNGTICDREFANILNRINCHVPNPRALFREFAASEQQRQRGRPSEELGRASMTGSAKPKGLTYSQVMTLLQRIKDTSNATGGGRSMANLIWDDLFGANTDKVSSAEFMATFCHGCQEETTVSRSDVQKLFGTLNAVEFNHRDDVASQLGVSDDTAAAEIGRTGFEILLYHELNDAYDPNKLGDSDDAEVALDKPLPRYWINTSHNTYLCGDQLASSSSVQCYMNALRRGCKCLEIDVWEGGTGSDGVPLPVVYHGYTATGKILFLDIIQGVASYMRDRPHTYPIILSLENHCSHPYQAAMAQILQGVLGDWLYVPTERDTQVELPSPERLRGKVVIKGKRPPDADETDQNVATAGTGDGATATAAREVDQDGDDDPYDTANATVPSVTADASSSKPSKIVKELARLTLFHGTKYKEFEKSLDEPRSHMHSVGETKVGKILAASASNTPMWRLYNVHHMTRTYPAGARVDSSNYNPLLAWSVGCQLVALNFQTRDDPLLINDGLFRQCRNRGYVCKPSGVLGKSDGIQAPDSARSGGKEVDVLEDVMNCFEDLACGEASTRKLLSKVENDAILRAQLEAKERALKEAIRPMSLNIRVLSGRCLPKPQGAKSGETIDPYVHVTLHDVMRGKDAKATYASTTNTTSAVNDNGFCPVWNETTFNEYLVYSPEVAQLQFTLYESDVGRDDKVACAVIPVSCLRSGYRSVQLYDMNNTRTGPFGMACLLVEVRQSKSPMTTIAT